MVSLGCKVDVLIEVTRRLPDNNEHYSRAPHHHHHHHHHDRLGSVRRKRAHDRDFSAPGISAANEHVHSVRHLHHDLHEKVVVSGDHDHVHVRRSPHHHHHHYDGPEKVVVSGDHDHVRVGRSPRPHHHHHHGYPKVVVSGDHDHVRFDRSPDGHRDFEDAAISRDNGHVHLQRSAFIAGEQGHLYVVPRAAKRSAAQKSLALEKRVNGLDGVPGHIDIMVRCFVIGR